MTTKVQNHYKILVFGYFTLVLSNGDHKSLESSQAFGYVYIFPLKSEESSLGEYNNYSGVENQRRISKSFQIVSKLLPRKIHHVEHEKSIEKFRHKDENYVKFIHSFVLLSRVSKSFAGFTSKFAGFTPNLLQSLPASTLHFAA